METRTKEEYLEYVSKYYEPYSIDCRKAINNLNMTANLHGYEDIPDITVRCKNANTRAVRFFKKFNMNYYDGSFFNKDRTIMLAVEHYLFDKMITAELLLNEYIKELNSTADNVAKSREYKLSEIYRKKISRITGKYPNYSKYFTHLSHYMEDYLRIADEVAEFEIEDKIEDVIIYYLPFLYKQALKTKYDQNVSVNLLIANAFFMERVYSIIFALEKIGRQELTSKVLKEAETIMTEKLHEEENKYNEEQNKKQSEEQDKEQKEIRKRSRKKKTS